MPDTVNPYIPGQPVDTPEMFFGRREVLTSIREHLLKGRRVFVVSGPPRIGRSSLLRHLDHELHEEYLPIRFDLIEDNSLPLDRLLWRLAKAVGEGVRRRIGGGELEAAWVDFQGNPSFLVDDFCPPIRAVLGDLCLVLLLDDLDSLEEVGADRLSGLMAVLEAWRDRDGQVAVVLATSPAQQERLVREQGRLFGGVMTYVIGPLNSEEASRLITWPVDGVLTYDYGVARRLIEITSGQPYYLQLLCFEIFNRCAAAGWVNQRDVDLVVEDLVGREIGDFRQLWNESTSQEQAVLAALVSLRGARGVATVQEVRTSLNKAGSRAERDQVASALDSLAERGILERLGALSYRFRVELLRDWLRERLDLQDVARHTRWGGAEKARTASPPGVLRLSTSKEDHRKAAAQPKQAAAEAVGEGKEQTGRAGRRRWLRVAAAAAVVLLLTVVLGMRLFRPEPITATPVGGLALSPTAHLAATIPLRTSTPTRPPASSAAPTDSPTLGPTDTPSPTPPLVVARAMPSIAYQSREQGERAWSIHVMNSDGSSRIRLTEGQAGFLSPPTWSPNGSRIAFVSDREGNPDIWVMDSDGGNLSRLTDHVAKDHSPAWSPDGEWIAFASVRDSLYWELYLMRPDGSDVQRLTWWEDASDLSPSWSPDGTRLVFASKRDGNWEIYTMDRDGGNLTRLTNEPADDTNPAWSPDGSRIAFESTREGYAEIYLMPVTGGGEVNISNAPFSSEHGPTWSPDGGRVAFYSDRDGEWDIYVMASDGSEVTKLTGDTSNDQVPSWRP